MALTPGTRLGVYDINAPIGEGGVSLKRVSAGGGPVRVVVDHIGTFGGAGGTWAADGTIVFSSRFDLFRVPADGGAVAAVTKAPTQDWSYYWPSFLPDGRRFLFTAKLWTAPLMTPAILDQVRAWIDEDGVSAVT